jgi:Heavy-metal resistance
MQSSLSKTVLIALLVGVLVFAATFAWRKHHIDEHIHHLSAFAWFCEEFAVSPAQQTKIEALHREYFPECEDHCIHYADTRETLAKINEDPQLDHSEAHREAAARLVQLEQEADQKFIAFIYAVAAEMDAVESERYLSRMKGWLEHSPALAGE